MPRRPRRARDAELFRAIGRRVRDARAVRGLTQEALGEAASLLPEAVSRIETARVSPDLTTLSAIAAGLGLGLAELVEPTRPLHVDGLSVDELAILAEVRTLEPRQRRALRTFLSTLTRRG